MPTSAPVPTADIGCALVKISASGPMPTSRYCDHAPCAISTSFSARGLGRAGLDAATGRRRSPRRSTCARASACAGVAARLLLDHALEHAGDEGDAGGLDRLQVAGREQPRRRGGRGRAPRPSWRARRRARRRAAERRRRGSRPTGSSSSKQIARRSARRARGRTRRRRGRATSTGPRGVGQPDAADERARGR